jgi:methyl-accepting chemotaxis protein
MCRAMLDLASGNFDVVLPGLGREDELGEMAGAVEEFKRQAIAKAEHDAAAQDGQAREASAARRAELIRFADNFEAAVGSIVSNVSASAGQLEQAAGTLTQTAETTQSLSEPGCGQAPRRSRPRSNRSQRRPNGLGGRNRRAGAGVESDRRSRRPAGPGDRRPYRQIVARGAADWRRRQADYRNCRADQSARTQRHDRGGSRRRCRLQICRGAAEVKSLADQTTKATDEISNHVSGMQEATRESVAAIKQIGATIGQISRIASAIASAVDRQGAATIEIARNAQSVAGGARTAATNIVQVNRGATETVSASGQVLGSAKALSSESARLRAELDRFMANIRAA